MKENTGNPLRLRCASSGVFRGSFQPLEINRVADVVKKHSNAAENQIEISVTFFFNGKQRCTRQIFTISKTVETGGKQQLLWLS